MHEMPKMTTTVIGNKGVELDREVKYLLNKAKIARAEKEREKAKQEAEEKAKKEAEEKANKKKKKDKKKDGEAAKEGEAEVEAVTSEIYSMWTIS